MAVNGNAIAFRNIQEARTVGELLKNRVGRGQGKVLFRKK